MNMFAVIFFSFLGILVATLIILSFYLACLSGYLGKRLQLSVGHNGMLDKKMDEVLSNLLDKVAEGEVEVTEVGPYTMDFSNGYKVWVANKYYAYGNIHKTPEGHVRDHRVRVKTALRVIKLEKEYMSKNS